MKTITTTSKAKYHKPDTTIEVVDSLADKMIAMGWAVPEGSTPEGSTPTVEAPVVQPAMDVTVESLTSKKIKKQLNTKK